jgi:chemotaxis methyl-accepting protein methylase
MSDSIIGRLSRVTILRRCMGRPFLRANEWVWARLPSSLSMLRPVRLYGNFLQSLVRLRTKRTQFHGTFFLRNRPALELIRSLAARKPEDSTLRLAVLGCSNGAEVYSILWTIRSARPDLRLEINAIDTSAEILEVAKNGVYSLGENPLVPNAPIMERLYESEMSALFDKGEKDEVRIKPWILQGVHWQLGDAGDPNLAGCFERADIVVANNFLCHMAPTDAERCLRNLPHFVTPGGHLFVSGVDLDVRTKVALELGWTPVPDLLEEIHEGDPCLRNDWPWQYWGLEPFDPQQPDWNMRYAAFYQVGSRQETRETASVDN